MAPVSYKDVEIAVSRALGANVKILHHALDPFSKDKNGILGTHSSLTVKVQKNGEIETRTFFVKTPPDSSVIQDLIMEESMVADEALFYSEIYPRMVESYKGERWSPKCYLAREDILISEDLRAQGYAIRPDSSLDVPSLKSALTALARFHASSLLTEAKLGKSLRDVYPKAFVEKMYSNVNKFGKGTMVGFDTMSLMAEKFGFDASLVPNIYDYVYRKVRGKDGECNVVCHGDLWKNNLMFDNSTPPKCILVDFQLLRYASPTIDFGMLFYLHTTPDYRRRSEYDMFQYYYKALKGALLQSDYDERRVPTYEALLKDYKERRIVGMAYGVLYLSGILLKPELLTKLMNDPILLEKWFYHERFHIIRSNMEVDPVYEDRMKDIISEILEEARLLFN